MRINLKTYDSLFGNRGVRGISNAKAVRYTGVKQGQEVKLNHNLGRKINGVMSPDGQPVNIVRSDTQSITLSNTNIGERKELIIY
jgi:hypothetical protein